MTLTHPSLNEDGLVPSCAGCDVNAWFDMHTGNGSLNHESRAALRICESCPVKEMCLEWGVAHEEYGIWGGKMEEERREIRRERGITLAAPEVAVMNAFFAASRPEDGVRDPNTYWDDL